MSLESIKEAVRELENQFREDWNNRIPLFEESMDDDDIQTAHARLSIRVTGKVVSADGSYVRRSGTIFVVIRSPKGTSSYSALDEADVATGYLDSITTTSGIQTMTPDIAIIGDVGNWYQVNVSVPFYYSYSKGA